MTTRRVFLAAVAAGVAGIAASANADILANWTYEVSIPATSGPFAAEAGVNGGNSSGFHAGASTYSSPSGNGSAHSFSSNTWAIGDYYQFTTSTTGYQGISIQWDQVSSNTGPRDFSLEWSTNGVTFTSIGAVISAANLNPPGFWNATTGYSDYTHGPTAGPGSLDNQATVYFRLRMTSNVSANGSTVGTGGTNRVDNVIISGTAIPAPGAIALAGIGGLIAGRRRRN